MAPIDEFTIVLDNPKMFHSPGNEISGRVYLRLNSPMTVRMVHVLFHGRGEVHHGKREDYRHKVQHYFYYETVLYDVDNETVDQQFGGNFPAGEFSFPFIFRLPDNLPSTYRDRYGNVKYWFKASMGWEPKGYKKFKLGIFVIDTVDVNTPELQQCFTHQEEETISCCCVKGGKINVSGKINKCGFYAGEDIETKVYVENQSNREVTYTEVRLLKFVIKKYEEADHKVDVDVSKVASVRGVGVPVGQEATITDMRLTIPDSLHPSTSMEDSIVKTAYRVEMIAHVKGACVSATGIGIAITIGFIPSPTGSSGMIPQAIGQPVNTLLDQETQVAGRQENQIRDMCF